MKRFAASVCLALGVAFAAACSPAAPEQATESDQAISLGASADFTPMLRAHGLERLVVDPNESAGRIVFSNGKRVTLTSKTIDIGEGPVDLIVAQGADGSHATMYAHGEWPVITTHGESHILFHASASVGQELAYWKDQGSAAFSLAGLIIDTMGAVYGVHTEEELTARLEANGAVPGISNQSSGGGLASAGGGGGLGGRGGNLRPMQNPPRPGGGGGADGGADGGANNDDDIDIPPPLTDAELKTIEIKRDVAVTTRDCVGPFVTTILAALAASWSCRLCARMIVSTVASAAGGPVALITLLGTAAACTICAVTMIGTIEGALNTYNGCVRGQQNDPFAPGGRPMRELQAVPIDMAHPALERSQFDPAKPKFISAPAGGQL